MCGSSTTSATGRSTVTAADDAMSDAGMTGLGDEARSVASKSAISSDASMVEPQQQICDTAPPPGVIVKNPPTLDELLRDVRYDL